MGFFGNSSNFIIEGDNLNKPPPNIPELMEGVANLVHRVTNDLPPGSKLICSIQKHFFNYESLGHFRGTLQPMDGNMSSYLKAELSHKDALLQAMNERKARKAEAARIGGMQYTGVGFREDYRARDGGATEPSRAPQIPFGSHPGFGTQQGMNPIMLPGPLPVDVSLQGVPDVPQGMNVQTREFPSYHPVWEENGYPMNASYFHGFHSVQGIPGTYIPPAHPPPDVHYPAPPHPKPAVESDELEEEAEAGEQSNSFRKRESRPA